jgi:hypothetical protein
MSAVPLGFEFSTVHGHLDDDDAWCDHGNSGVPVPGLAALNASIFADRAYRRAQLSENAAAAGLPIAQSNEFSAQMKADTKAPGNVVLLERPVIDGAALARLDMSAARIGSGLVVSTCMGSLKDLFGCLDQLGAQVLVSPNLAERAIAFCRVMARPGGKARMPELLEAARLALLRLTDVVSQNAQKLDQTSMTSAAAAGISRWIFLGMQFQR